VHDQVAVAVLARHVDLRESKGGAIFSFACRANGGSRGSTE
jgi:hypothetical protein